MVYFTVFCYNVGYKGVISLVNFCTCGSLIIEGHCSNKNCSFKTSGKSTSTNTRSTGKTRTSSKKKAVVKNLEENESDIAKSEKKEVTKNIKTKRASKCITYNINELNKKSESE